MGDIKNSISLFSYKKVLFFLLCAFLFVLVEQSFQTWTPTFYKEILKVPTSMSIQAGAVLAGAFALGRFLSGFFLKIQLDLCCFFCVVGFAISLLLVLPLTHSAAIDINTTWMNAPLVVYLFPLMGGFSSYISEYQLCNPGINPEIFTQCYVRTYCCFFSNRRYNRIVITGFVFQEFSGQRAFIFR
jgi:fucose permease